MINRIILYSNTSPPEGRKTRVAQTKEIIMGYVFPIYIAREIDHFFSRLFAETRHLKSEVGWNPFPLRAIYIYIYVLRKINTIFNL